MSLDFAGEMGQGIAYGFLKVCGTVHTLLVYLP